VALTQLLHTTLDNTVLLCGALAQSGRGFARTSGGAPHAYGELHEAFRRTPPAIRWESARNCRGLASGWERVPVEVGLEGESTCLDLRRAPGGNADTLVVHHHGLREVAHALLPHALSTRPILRERVDWVALKGLYHSSVRDVSRLTSCRNRFMRAVAASVAVARMVREKLGPRYRRVILSGVSLGGLVTLGAAAHEGGYCAYVPIVSGPNLNDVFFRSGISRLFQGGFKRKERRMGSREHLDLAAALSNPEGAPIRPLLGRYDRVFRLDAQLPAYQRIPRARVRVIDRGHISGPGSVRLVARHLAAVLDELEAPGANPELHAPEQRLLVARA
jgi:hypothetical protein